jgi:hypothetical protein
MGIQWDATWVIYRLQESLSFSWEGSGVEYSHWVWYTHETIQAKLECVNKTYGKVHMEEHLSDVFPIQNGLTEEIKFREWLLPFSSESSVFPSAT